MLLNVGCFSLVFHDMVKIVLYRRLNTDALFTHIVLLIVTFHCHPISHTQFLSFETSTLYGCAVASDRTADWDCHCHV